jgi:hypothetical protein
MTRRLLATLGVAAAIAAPVATMTACDHCPNPSSVHQVSTNPRCPR